uniref:Uncharacterized protein n=1 Tax=Arundo donax TaxID=35708 RepID=A0A0A9I1X5_ARUDO
MYILKSCSSMVLPPRGGGENVSCSCIIKKGRKCYIPLQRPF